jgi:hypothetical protein
MNAKLEGLKNFCQNVKPVMLKLHRTPHHGKVSAKLTHDERQQVVQFYLEVASYLNEQE